MAGTVVQEAGTLFSLKKQHIAHSTAFFLSFQALSSQRIFPKTSLRSIRVTTDS